MLTVISRWQLFTKMGYKGWTYLIPVYNFFCIIKALYGNGWLILMPLWISLGFGFVSGIGLLAVSDFRSRATLSLILIVIYSIIEIYLLFKYLFDFTHAFGKSGWWTVATCLFYPIMLIVYGIGDFEFKGRPFPDYDNYDAVDGFFEYYRNQKHSHQIIKETRRCKNCGAELRDNTIFCSQCGTKNDQYQ